MFSRKYKPLNIVWETTLKCNMNCIHCGSSAGSKRKKELSTEEAVNVLNDLKKLGTNLVTMMGGEPFLRKDWDIIAEHIKNIGMDILRHRVIISYEAEAEEKTSEDIIKKIFEEIEVP